MVHEILEVLRPRRNGGPSEPVEPEGRESMKAFGPGPVERSAGMSRRAVDCRCLYPTGFLGQGHPG